MHPDRLEGAEATLWELIEMRRKPDADREDIDQRIWSLFGDSCSVMFSDLSGFSRTVARFGILHFLQVIFEQQQLLLPLVAQAGGSVVKQEADSLLMLLPDPQSAVHAAIRMQRACASYNQGRAAEDQILLCLGIGFGRVLRVGEGNVYGYEVNLASKLGEDVATSGEILLSEAAMQAAGKLPSTRYERVSDPIEHYRLHYTSE